LRKSATTGLGARVGKQDQQGGKEWDRVFGEEYFFRWYLIYYLCLLCAAEPLTETLIFGMLTKISGKT